MLIDFLGGSYSEIVIDHLRGIFLRAVYDDGIVSNAQRSRNAMVIGVRLIEADIY